MKGHLAVVILCYVPLSIVCHPLRSARFDLPVLSFWEGGVSRKLSRRVCRYHCKSESNSSQYFWRWHKLFISSFRRRRDLGMGMKEISSRGSSERTGLLNRSYHWAWKGKAQNLFFRWGIELRCERLLFIRLLARCTFWFAIINCKLFTKEQNVNWSLPSVGTRTGWCAWFLSKNINLIHTLNEKR